MEKDETVKAIMAGLQKMSELKCQRTEIYVIGVSGQIVSPDGQVFQTRYVKISRVVNDQVRGIEVQCCKESKPYFVFPIGDEADAEKAVDWLLANKCLPCLSSMKTLVIPAQFIVV